MAKMNPALRSFWTTKADIKILKGGRASSKTRDTAGMAVFLASNYTVKFLCLRQFQNRISESVYAVLKIRIEEMGLLDEFELLQSVIRHKKTGSEFHFYGIHRNIAEIKGFEGANILWIEEAEGLTKEQWTIIEPTIREEGSEIWLLYNPRLVGDYIDTFESMEGAIVRHINYDENPFLSKTMLRKIERLKKADYDEYEHIYLGVPRSDDDKVVIKRSWIEAAIDAHIKLGIPQAGDKVIGFDVADGGKDKCSQIAVEGIVAYWGENWKAKEDELLKSCSRVYSKAAELESHIRFDSIGVGAGCGAKFNEINEARREEAAANGEYYREVTHSKFIAGGKVVDPETLWLDVTKNKDYFSNLKAQAWWIVAQRFMNTYNAVTHGEEFEPEELISISSDMPNLKDLVTQLSTPRRDFAKDGKVKVESKEDLEKRDVDSPNDADAFISAYAPTEDSGFTDLLKMSIG